MYSIAQHAVPNGIGHREFFARPIGNFAHLSGEEVVADHGTQCSLISPGETDWARNKAEQPSAIRESLTKAYRPRTTESNLHPTKVRPACVQPL